MRGRADDDLGRAAADIHDAERARRAVAECARGADEGESCLLLTREDPHPEPARGLDRSHQLGAVRRATDRRSGNSENLARAKVPRTFELRPDDPDDLGDLRLGDRPVARDPATDSRERAILMNLVQLLVPAFRHEQPGGVRADVDTSAAHVSRQP